MTQITFPAEVITIGNEVLSGQTLNTNAASIAQRLDELGLPVEWVTTVGDNAHHLRGAFETAWERARVTILTGGLGPTHDDITRTVFCEAFGRSLRQDEAVLDHIRHLFAARGRELTERNIDQARVPDRTEVLMNRWGTAPGVYMSEPGRHWFMLPGVPHEMNGLLESEVLPRLARLTGRQAIVRRELHVVGLPESYLMDRIDGIDGLESVASLPDSKGEVNLRICTTAPTREHAETQAARIEAALRDRLGTNIYGTGDETLEGVVGTILRERGMTIAVAESCTGGLVASRLTDVSGSSAYFMQGVVAYSNDAKTALLDVASELIAAHGAVSEQVARAMARGMRRRARTDIALGLTGIAGPTGGTPEKPVGLVYIALASEEGEEVQSHRFGAVRLITKQRAAQTALDTVRRYLLREAGEA